jgi:hypothetical protein
MLQGVPEVLTVPGGLKTDEQKKDMGSMCFLFRDPTAALGERNKPITSSSLANPWYRLLSELESRIATRGQTLANGSRLILVQPIDPKLSALPTKTYFPLHRLRIPRA